MMLNVVFRADASSIIGSGHIMRCLTLAHQLASKGANITFLTREHSGHLIDLISSFDYKVLTLGPPKSAIEQNNTDTWLGCSQHEDAYECIQLIKENLLIGTSNIDILIVDHYAIDNKWHQKLRSNCRSIMVIDDLANRQYDCDILLDQTLNRNKNDYLSIVPEKCRLLLGKDFMLLRKEFFIARSKAKCKQLDTNIKAPINIFISMGGGDPDNLTALAISSLTKLKLDIIDLTATVIISSKAKFISDIKIITKQKPWIFLAVDCQNIAELMLNSTIAVGASGATAWERCCLGLPCVTLVSADNQLTIAKNLASEQAIINLGWHKNVSADTLANTIKDLINDTKRYDFMVKQCFSSCDGLGVEKVAFEVFDYKVLTSV